MHAGPKMTLLPAVIQTDSVNNYGCRQLVTGGFGAHFQISQAVDAGTEENLSTRRAALRLSSVFNSSAGPCGFRKQQVHFIWRYFSPPLNGMWLANVPRRWATLAATSGVIRTRKPHHERRRAAWHCFAFSAVPLSPPCFDVPVVTTYEPYLIINTNHTDRPVTFHAHMPGQEHLTILTPGLSTCPEPLGSGIWP